MRSRSSLSGRASVIGAMALAGLAAGGVLAPAAWAMSDPDGGGPTATVAQANAVSLPGQIYPSYLGTPDQPTELNVGQLLVDIGEEPGNELGVPVDLSGALVGVAITPQGGDEDVDTEFYLCETDEMGNCGFVDDDGQEVAVNLLSGDTVTIQQLAEPSSGIFTLPPEEDDVIYATVADYSGVQPPRTTPITPAAPSGAVGEVVDRIAPDVVGRAGRFQQVVFFDPLATGTDDGPTDDTSDTPDSPTQGTDTGHGAGAGSAQPGVDAPAEGTTEINAPAPATTTGAPRTAAGINLETAAAAATATAPRSEQANLAHTGDDLMPQLVLGGILTAVGAAGVLLARRRSTR